MEEYWGCFVKLEQPRGMKWTLARSPSNARRDWERVPSRAHLDQRGVRIGGRNVRVVDGHVIFRRGGVVEFGLLGGHGFLAGGDEFGRLSLIESFEALASMRLNKS
jgi:hypothetical protein